jgi:MFS family permease
MAFHHYKTVSLPLIITLMVQALVSMAATTVPVVAPAAAKDIGISATYVGIYVGLIYASATISSLFSGNFVLKYGAIRISQLCLLCCALGLAMTATAFLPAAVVGALVIGIGYGPTTPASSHILVRTTPPHLMSFVFSLKQTGVPLGGAMAGAIVPALVLFLGWKIAAFSVAAFCLGLAVLAQPFRKGLDNDRQRNQCLDCKGAVEPLKLALSDARIRQLSMASFFFAGMQLCLISYLVTFLAKDLGMTLIRAGLVLATAQTAGVIGRIIWGALADRHGRPRLILAFLGFGMSLGAVMTAFFSPSWPFTALILVSVGFGATAIGWNGVYLAEVARLAPPGLAGMATGGTLFFTFLGVVVGPPVFGTIVETTGSFPLGYFAFAALTTLSSIVLLLTKKQ